MAHANPMASRSYRTPFLSSLARMICCMTVLTSTRHKLPSVSAASFVHQIIGAPLISRPSPSSPSRHIKRSANAAFSGSAISALPQCSAFSACCNIPSSPSLRKLTRNMSASSSQEGLSDIGQPTTTGSDSDGSSGIPNWKERIDISIAKSRKIRGSNYVQISTINYETMEPRCRTVVFRGFLKGVPFGAVEEVLADHSGSREEGGGYDCVMKMITDLRSNKVQELEMFHELKSGGNKNANTVEMVWWFPKSSEQYRISGRLQFIGSNGPLYSYPDGEASEQSINYFLAERKQQWGNLSDMAREQFYWENPGIPFTSTWEEAKGVPTGGRDEEGKVLPPPDTFLMMLLYPTKIDYLRLGDNFRQIDEWDWGGEDDSVCQWKSKRVNP